MYNEIIDFEKKGNVIRFYLGKNGEQWGDDWNDIPYEYNAETVYDEYIKGHCDIAVDFDYEAEEVANDYNNSPYSKEMMRDRKIYAIRIYGRDKGYEELIKHIYFGDKIEDILKLDYVKLLTMGDYIK